MAPNNQFKRKEYKYYVPIGRLEQLRERTLMHMEHDDFCKRRPSGHYSVRSIYFDTRRRLFYFEKLDGVKIRKKLRVRCYDAREDNPAAFLEIKRKYKNTIFKERAGVPITQTPNLTNGAHLTLSDEEPTYLQQAALDKFVYLIKRLNLEPTVLVTYEREAFRGIEEPDLRVTFDLNVRSYVTPDIDDLFREEDLRTFADPWFILEVKFYGKLPFWIRQMIRDLRLRRQSISKYCWGIDAWTPRVDVPGPD